MTGSNSSHGRVTGSWKSYTILFLFIWMTCNFFPGSYNVDTWYQFFNMTSHDWDDWHSPFMALVWRVLYSASDRFFSLYIFQMAWYFFYVHVFTGLLSRRWLVVIAILGSVFFVFIPQYLMKDVHQALAWCSALLLLVLFQKSRQRHLLWLALLLVAYGILLRPNGLPAALPLIAVILDGFDLFRKRRLLRYAATLGAGLLIFAFYYVVLWGVLQARPAYFTYKYRLADVLGISVMSGTNYMPDCVTSWKGYSQRRVETMYTPATNDNIYFSPDTIIPPPTAERDACVKEAWMKAVTAHPFIYLKSRAIGYLYYLKIVRRVPAHDYWNVMVYVVRNNYIPIDDKHTRLTTLMLKGWKKLDRTFVYDAWFWLLTNLVLAFLFYKAYKRTGNYAAKAQLALQLAGIIYQLSLFPFYQIDLDFRFSYLNAVAACTGALFYIDERLKGVRLSPEEQQSVADRQH